MIIEITRGVTNPGISATHLYGQPMASSIFSAAFLSASRAANSSTGYLKNPGQALILIMHLPDGRSANVPETSFTKTGISAPN